MMDDYVATFTDCTQLRTQSQINGRYMRPEFGSLNITTNGHPSASGALDQKTLCIFSKDQGVCAARTADKKPPTSVESQRAVRGQMVKSQLQGSFRSIERASLPRGRDVVQHAPPSTQAARAVGGRCR